MKNVSIDEIKRQLNEVLGLFDANSNSYNVIVSCIKSNSVSEMSSLLNSLNLDKNVAFLNNFFDDIRDKLKSLSLIEKKIDDMVSSINEKIKLMKENFDSRNVSFNSYFVSADDLSKMSYLQMNEYLEKLAKMDNDLSSELEAFEKEKKSGESFDDKLDVRVNGSNSHNAEISNIQKNSSNNIKKLDNPDSSVIRGILDEYRRTQDVNNAVNADIVYSNNGTVSLNIGYKGTKVDESKPLYSCCFSDASYFNATILPILVEERLVDRTVSSDLYSGNVNASNRMGESLNVVGNPVGVAATASFVNSVYNANENSKVSEKIYDVDKHNVKEFNNPDFNAVSSFMNYYRDSDDSNLKMNIMYSEDNRAVLEIGSLKKNNADGDVVFKCVYDDVNYFKDDILPELIEDHVANKEVNSSISDDANSFSSVNGYGESLDVSGNKREVVSTYNNINDFVLYTKNSKERTNDKVLVRKLDIKDAAFSNGVVVALLVMASLFLIFAVSLLFLSIR